MAPKGPFRILAVNASAENSKGLVALVQSEVKDDYTLELVGNSSTADEVEGHVKELNPDLVVIASSFDEAEAKKIEEIVTKASSSAKVSIIPQGLQAEKGPRGVVDYVKEQLPTLLT